MQRLETRLRVLTLLFRSDPETAIEADAEAGDQAQGGILTLLLGSPDNQ